MARRLYFDNAATSFPKAPGVYEAMARYGTEIGASPGRGAYAEAVEGGRILRTCRERIARLIGGQSPEHVIFTLNATDALNLAIKGVVAQRRLDKPRDPVHIVATAMDHNSVLRPIRGLEAFGVEWTCVPADGSTGLLDPAAVRRAITPHTALVVLVHASNVTGVIQPAREVGEVCRERRVPMLLDAAQTVGHIAVDVGELRADLLAFPGHKGLLGPAGTGALYITPGVEPLVRPTREGGTGSASDLDVHPADMPDRYEAGSHNSVGIAGLAEGVRYVLERGSAHFEHERALTGAMLDALRPALDLGLELVGPRSPERRVGVFSVRHPALAPHELCMILEQQFDILARAGIHCAPRAHAALGTADGGTTRLSLGPFLTRDDVRYAGDALAEVCRQARSLA